jgi:hypothetical protein
MIQLANDPNASRIGYRPAQNDGKGRAFDHSRSRSGRAWPFLSQYAGRPAPQNGSKSSSSDSAS